MTLDNAPMTIKAINQAVVKTLIELNLRLHLGLGIKAIYHSVNICICPKNWLMLARGILHRIPFVLAHIFLT